MDLLCLDQGLHDEDVRMWNEKSFHTIDSWIIMK
jgi:hypothetical protein